jgi:hypothetical protein
VQVYRYLEEETSRFALTRDVGGAALPAFGAVWLYAGAEDLGAYPARVKSEILKKGYYLWPDDAEPRASGGARDERALD